MTAASSVKDLLSGLTDCKYVHWEMHNYLLRQFQWALPNSLKTVSISQLASQLILGTLRHKGWQRTNQLPSREHQDDQFWVQKRNEPQALKEREEVNDQQWNDNQTHAAWQEQCNSVLENRYEEDSRTSFAFVFKTLKPQAIQCAEKNKFPKTTTPKSIPFIPILSREQLFGR